MISIFHPALAGANLRDRLAACVGAAIGISLTAWISAMLVDPRSALFLVAPMGASAVLIFAVPASPLAQPWPVIGGNILSALVGITVVRILPVPALAAGIAVAAAILVMSLARALHPPGGAAALLAVLGGPAVHAGGYGFALWPVGLNALVLAILGVAWHKLSGHSYPHRAADVRGSAVLLRPAPHSEDLEKALAELGETFDISAEDLDLLFDRVAHHAAARAGK